MLIDGFDKKFVLGIIGAGLIGSSVAKNVKKIKGEMVEILAFTRTQSPEMLVRNGGVYGEVYVNDLSKIAKCDVVVIATPVGVFLEICVKIAKDVRENKILVMDACSVKAFPLAVCSSLFLDFFVPCHPIAGSHKTGHNNSEDSMIENAGRFIICDQMSVSSKSDLLELRKYTKQLPSIGNPILTQDGTCENGTCENGACENGACKINISKKTVNLAEKFWVECCNVKVDKIQKLDALEHDRIYGYVSHLPHVMMICLVKLLAKNTGMEDELEKVRKYTDDSNEVSDFFANNSHFPRMIIIYLLAKFTKVSQTKTTQAETTQAETDSGELVRYSENFIAIAKAMRIGLSDEGLWKEIIYYNPAMLEIFSAVSENIKPSQERGAMLPISLNDIQNYVSAVRNTISDMVPKEYEKMGGVAFADVMSYCSEKNDVALPFCDEFLESLKNFA